jgi:hypothetical protein
MPGMMMNGGMQQKMTRMCRRKIEMSPVAQSRDDTPVGGGDDERDGITTKRWARASDIRNYVCWLTQASNQGVDCILAVRSSSAFDCLAGSGLSYYRR